jgi:spore coat polysaccharide biosynthesis predicted glycosyltransferase SpsG
VIDLSDKLLRVVTEGGKEFGFGHITRCLSIAKVFQKHGFVVEFIVNGDESITRLLDGYTFSLIDWKTKLKSLNQKIEKSSLILIDSMQISNSQLLKLQETNIPLIYIDDEKRRNILTKGFVIDWTVLSDEQNHFLPKQKNVVYFLGSKYTPLRDGFESASKHLIKDKVTKIMLTFGGADVRNLSPSVLRVLTKNFTDCEKNIVVGAGFTNTKEIQECKDENTNLIFNADTKTMINLMQESDLAIASGGQTLYELARIGTPTIAILLVENARDDTQGWHKVGSLENLGMWDDEKLDNKLLNAMKKLQDKKLRESMQNSAAKYISPHGAELLVQKILESVK